MKSFLSISVALFIVLHQCEVNGQQQSQSIVLSPLIGDTLDVEEHNSFRLLQNVDGFQWAVFYLKPDSTVAAKVHYYQNGIERDTLINNYRSFASLRYQINYIYDEQVQTEKDKIGFTILPKTFMNAEYGYAIGFNAYCFGGNIDISAPFEAIAQMAIGDKKDGHDYSALARLIYRSESFSLEFGAMYLMRLPKGSEVHPSIVVRGPKSNPFLFYSVYDNSNAFLATYAGGFGFLFTDHLHLIIITYGYTGLNIHDEPSPFLSMKSEWHFWKSSWLIFNIAIAEMIEDEVFFAMGWKQNF